MDGRKASGWVSIEAAKDPCQESAPTLGELAWEDFSDMKRRVPDAASCSTRSPQWSMRSAAGLHQISSATNSNNLSDLLFDSLKVGRPPRPEDRPMGRPS